MLLILGAAVGGLFGWLLGGKLWKTWRRIDLGALSDGWRRDQIRRS